MNKKLLLSTLAIACLSFQAGAAIIFTETFDNTTGGNLPLGDLGWAATYDPDATAYDVSDSNNSGSTDGADKPLVSGAASSEGSTAGYVFQNPFRNNTPIFIYTNGLSLGQTTGVDNVLNEVTFALRNTATDMDFRIALEIGAGNWFIADDTFNNTTSNAWTTGLQLDVGAATWRDLTVNVGTEISIAGSTTSLAAGDLTGIGFYTAKGGNGNNIRIDTLNVDAVPEPATYALIGGALALGLVLVRRRRS